MGNIKICKHYNAEIDGTNYKCEYCEKQNKKVKTSIILLVLMGVLITITALVMFLNTDYVIELANVLIVEALISLIIMMFLIYFEKEKSKKEKEIEILDKYESYNMLKNIKFVCGLPFLNKDDICNMYINDNYITVVRTNDNKEIKLNIKKVLSFGKYTEEEINKMAVNKNGNIIGRGILGGLILGPVGAFLGATSAIGSKQEIIVDNDKTNFIIINYSGDTENYAINFKYKSSNNLETFVNNVNTLLPNKIEL